MQDPKLAKWWAEAANYRRRGVDRVLVPAPWTRTIEQLCADGVRADVYAHEQIQVPQGTAGEFLDIVRDEAAPAYEKFGWQLVGAWQTAMVNEGEAFLLWAIPTFAQWGEAEKAAAHRRRPRQVARPLVRPLDPPAPVPARRRAALPDAHRPSARALRP